MCSADDARPAHYRILILQGQAPINLQTHWEGPTRVLNLCRHARILGLLSVEGLLRGTRYSLPVVSYTRCRLPLDMIN